MNSFVLSELICRVLILLTVFPAHELAHALLATRFGDPTPRAAGRLTLNPIKHLNLFGSLLFIVAGIGWASTPINPAYFEPHRREKMGLVAFSGPVTNLALAILGTIPFYLFHWLPIFDPSSPYLPSPAYFFTMFVVLNLLLAMFNLIPIAPLDGSQVLGAFLSGPAAQTFDTFQRYGPLALMVVVVVLPMAGIDVIGFLIQSLVAPIFQLLFIGVG